MTFKRMSTMAEIICKYENYEKKCLDDRVVVFIGFDILSEMRAMCANRVFLTKDGEETFMGCPVRMSHEKNYLAVAYENNGKYHEIVEVMEEQS